MSVDDHNQNDEVDASNKVKIKFEPATLVKIQMDPPLTHFNQ